MFETEGLQPNGGEAANEDVSSAPETESSGETPSTDLAPNPADNIIDLDKTEKFRLHGEEWTRDKLASAMLRQADYTRKTQEIKQEHKYYDNLSYDIANVLKNPALVEQFKQTYPEKFHRYLDAYSDYLQTKQSEGNPQAKQANAVDPQLMSRINQIESRFRDQEVKAADAMLDGVFKKYSTQYQYADESSVISKALALMEQKKKSGGPEDLTNQEWDYVFKTEHDRVKALAEKTYKETMDKQLRANRKAKDSAAGGNAPGGAPVRMTIKEATEAAIRDLSGR